MWESYVLHYYNINSILIILLRYLFTYLLHCLMKVKEDLESRLVCKKAFCSLHGVSLNRVDRICDHLKYNITSPRDQRGCHGNQRKIPSDIKKQLDEHIRSFPKRRTHYGRKENDKKYYLS